jgi:hypothetical protein
MDESWAEVRVRLTRRTAELQARAMAFEAETGPFDKAGRVALVAQLCRHKRHLTDHRRLSDQAVSDEREG